MATKNLTRPFKSLRDGFDRQRGRRDAGSNPVGAGANSASVMPADSKPVDAPPPFWVDTVSSIEEVIKTIEELIAKLQEAHKNRLLVRFDNDADVSRDKEIDVLTTQITKRFKEAERQLKLISGQSNTGDEEIQKNIQHSMANKLQGLSMNFRKSQKQYMSRLKMQKSGKTILFDEEDETEKGKHGRGDGQFTLSDAELLEFESTSVNLKERDNEILKLVKNIEELGMIFKELGLLVLEQGTIFDRIDTNMDMVVDSTIHAVKELEETEKLQKKNPGNRCILILLVIIFILLVILVFKHS